jgi:hypothetical protein
MARYQICDYQEATNYQDPQLILPELLDEPWAEDCEGASFLIDTLTGEVVFSDAGEPEDATLARNYRPLVDLLNKE